MTSASPNRWWQNWPKTHAYVAEKMFYPTTAAEIATAIQAAETDHRPVRAVGGGWSFSDAALPGTVTTNRPSVHAVESLARVVPRAIGFPDAAKPPDRTKASIATITAQSPIADLKDAMVMLADDGKSPPAPDPSWSYMGTGLWLNGSKIDGVSVNADFVNSLGASLRPIRNPMGVCLEDADTAGSMVMFDLAKNASQASRDWFYNGKGVWSVGVAGDSPPDRGNLRQLSFDGRLTSQDPNMPMRLAPRAANAADSLALVLAKQKTVPAATEPVYLINTRSLVSSLQQQLPSILSASAASATASPTNGERRFFFHVEAGITIAELGTLLGHQSPRLSVQAISGSPGATLAGAIATGTHGAEFNWRPLVDRVKAVHLVGPGGLQWWIEGEESIADPHKLQAMYPDIPLERIIAAPRTPGGVARKDWLNAAIVSMGSMGVIYSVVLEVVPLFGVHEVVVQTTWRKLPVGTRFASADRARLLRSADTSTIVSGRIVKLLQAGNLNGTGIDQVDGQGYPLNQYADLAINPNRRPDGDFDCWIGNRELATELPIDPQPATSDGTGEMLAGVLGAIGSGDVGTKLRGILGVTDHDIANQLTDKFLGRQSLGAMRKLDRVTQSADVIDMALDTLLTPMEGHADGPEVAQAFLSGLLAGLLGTANCDRRSDKIGVSVGNLGFPASGVMGTGIEIALSPDDAFGFLQTEILDRVDMMVDQRKPFFGYVSIRLCSTTDTLMGMTQFSTAANPCSVMIEMVGYATPGNRLFLQELQKRTVDRMQNGLNAMLHWGLENEQLRGHHLRRIRALQATTASGLSKLGTFIAVRSLLHAAAPTAYRVFDNSFTERLGLSDRQDAEPYDFGTAQLGARKSVTLHFRNTGTAPQQIRGLMLDGDFRRVDIPASPTDGTPAWPHNIELQVTRSSALPGEEIEVIATFIAQRGGPHLGVLTIETDATDLLGPIKVRLHATVEVFAVTLVDPLPPGLDLGAVGIEDTLSGQVVIRNDGTVNATLESFTFSNPAIAQQVGIETGSLRVGETRTYAVNYRPDTVGHVTSDVILHFTDGVLPSQHAQDVIVQFAATGIGMQAELSPSVIDFGSVPVGAEGTPVAITLENTGLLALTITGVSVNPDFRLIGARPSSVAPGDKVQLYVAFRPGHAGALSSTFSIASDSVQPPVPVALRGTGVLQPLLRATPAALLFDPTPIGSRREEVIVVSNPGALPVQLGAISLVGRGATDVQLTGSTCKGILRAEDQCEIRVAFSPSTAGATRSSLEILGASSALRVPLTGEGVTLSGLVADLSEIDFGALALGIAAGPRTVVMTNRSATRATLGRIAISGLAASEVTVVSDDCSGAALDVDQQCTIVLSIRPASLGLRRASVDLGGNIPTQEVAIRGTGTGSAVEWSTKLADFGDGVVGVQSPRQDVYLRNSGNTTLTVGPIEIVGDFIFKDLVPQTLTLPPNGEKIFWVWFKPSGAGLRQGSLRVQSDAASSPDALDLTGVGFAPR